ncbi:type III-B CRISPR module RAMP protein Cmr1 [Fervidobacterium sp.]
MKKLTLTCRLITPMFMSGALPGESPELRPSEFKGMLRFWWRAIKCESDISKLREEEFKIFGGILASSSNRNISASRSSITLRIYSGNELDISKRNVRSEHQLIWDYDSMKKTLKGEHSGIAYLLYSVIRFKVKENEYHDYLFLKPRQTFKLSISSYDEMAFKNAVAALWASIYLGGFGARSRRGGGNLEVTEVEGETCGLNFILNESNDNVKLKEFLTNNLRSIFQIVNSEHGSRQFRAPYSCLSFRGVSKIIIFPRERSWIDALNKAGEFYRVFRDKHKAKIFEVAVFGMPIVHKSSNTKIVHTYSDRMDSPLIIKVIKAHDDNYFPVFIRLSSNIPGKIIKVKLKSKSNENTDQGDSKAFKLGARTLLDDFFDDLEKQGGAVSITSNDL